MTTFWLQAVGNGEFPLPSALSPDRAVELGSPATSPRVLGFFSPNTQAPSVRIGAPKEDSRAALSFVPRTAYLLSESELPLSERVNPNSGAYRI